MNFTLIDITKLDNFYYILYTILLKNDREKWIYLTKNRYDILLSPTTIKLSKGYFKLSNSRRLGRYQIPVNNQQSWLIKDCIEIYYTLILINCSKKELNIFCQIPVEVIKKIYLMLFI